MLSASQKMIVFQSVLKSYTIGGKAYNPSVIYSNQKITSYPVIVLNYPEQELKAQNSVGEYLGTPGSKGQRSFAMLSINIYARGDQDLNAHTIAEQLAAQLGNDIRGNWGSLDSGSVRFNRKTPTKDLSNLFKEPGVDNARMQFDVYLLYDIVW